MVTIGIDPHKGSHTAVALDGNEVELARLTVRAGAHQRARLLRWASGFDERVWAIESAGGLGYLLAQQLVAAGERVLDVPATLSARARVLDSGRSDKNDPNDARAAAVVALRGSKVLVVGAAGDTEVLRMLARRNVELGQSTNKACCRLHALLVDMVPGGSAKAIAVAQVSALLADVKATNPVEAQRLELAWELLADVDRLRLQRRDLGVRIAKAVTASGTGLTDIFGVGPVVACMVIGHTGDIDRFATRHRYAAYNGTAPREVSSGGKVRHRLSRRGNRQLNHAIHIVAITQIRFPQSPGRAFYDRKIAEGKTHKEALRALKRRVSDVIYRQLVADAERAAASPVHR